MEWVQFVIFFLGVFGLFIWNRTESRTDYRHVQNILEGQRSLMEEIRKESRAFKDEWMQETKDFHKRLCDIEAKK
jgi:hypothetical protein